MGFHVPLTRIFTSTAFATRPSILILSTHCCTNLQFYKMTTAASAPSFSSNTDPATAVPALYPLLASNGGRWTLTSAGNGMEREVKFKTFKRTWDFMNAVAEECKVQKHHPEWSNIYNTTYIRWTTHSPPGLSDKDILMAAFCDKQAEIHGEIIGQLGTAGQSTKGRELADRVVDGAGACCVPGAKAKA